MLQVHSDQWHRDVKSLALLYNVNPRRWGMRSTVYLGADAGEYVLTYNLNSTRLSDNANWLKVADIGQAWGTGGGGTRYMKYWGNWPGTGGLYPNGFAGVKAGDQWKLSVATVMPDGFEWPAGTICEATVDDPDDSTPTDWRLF